jgi:hypothetical protein
VGKLAKIWSGDPNVVSKAARACRRFLLIYVLKDSITSQFEGHGVHRMTPGDAWLQPKNLKHKVLDYSDDCEVLEIVMPLTGGAIFPGSRSIRRLPYTTRETKGGADEGDGVPRMGCPRRVVENVPPRDL